MIFDVMIQEGTNEAGKQIVNVYRVHDRMLSGYLREAQVYGKFIIAVIPLFANKRKDQEQLYSYSYPVEELKEVKEVKEVESADYPAEFLEDDTRM